MQQRQIVFVRMEKWNETPKGRDGPKASMERVVQAIHAS